MIDRLSVNQRSGGCFPIARSAIRRLIKDGRFIRNAATVARAAAVFPMILVKSSDHSKCSSHASDLGWKNRATRPLSGSIAAVLFDLKRLHPPQAQARLSSSVGPSRLRGRMCSDSNKSDANESGARQYSQWPRARLATVCRNDEGTLELAMGRLKLERCHQIG